jgi:hypothetical protein
VALLAGVAVLAWAAPAPAGTYTVVACDAPGANGVNRSWTPVVSELGGPHQPEVFDFHPSCSTGLGVSSHSPEQRTSSFLSGGSWQFNAPAGTSIVGVRATRYGEVRSSADDPNTGGPENGDWDVFLQDASGAAIGGQFGPEQCNPERTGGLCTVGTLPRGGDTGQLRIAPTSRLAWGIVCAGDNLAFCFTNAGPGFGNYPLGIFWLYGATVTLEDTSAPDPWLDGAMFAGGWRRPTDAIAFSAADNSGIRTAQLLIDGADAGHADQRCDASVTVPCPNVGARSASIGPLADGRHQIRLVVTDSAGNPATLDRTVDVDGDGPRATIKRPSGKTIRIAVSDAGSGVKFASLEVRNRSDEPFRTLPAEIVNGVLRATLDRGRASAVGIRVLVTDFAGNVTSGQLTEMSLRAHGHALRSGGTKVRYGRRTTFFGRLTTREGVPLAGQPVTVEQLAPAPANSSAVTTDAKGRFQ